MWDQATDLKLSEPLVELLWSFLSLCFLENTPLTHFILKTIFFNHFWLLVPIFFTPCFSIKSNLHYYFLCPLSLEVVCKGSLLQRCFYSFCWNNSGSLQRWIRMRTCLDLVTLQDQELWADNGLERTVSIIVSCTKVFHDGFHFVRVSNRLQV